MLTKATAGRIVEQATVGTWPSRDDQGAAYHHLPSGLVGRDVAALCHATLALPTLRDHELLIAYVVEGRAVLCQHYSVGRAIYRYQVGRDQLAQG